MNPAMGQSAARIKAEQQLAERGELVFRFPRNHIELRELTKHLSIDKVTPDSIYAYANAREFNHFLSYNIGYEVVSPPGKQTTVKSGTLSPFDKAWDTYPGYDAYTALMTGFAADFPEICRLDTIGTTTEGRHLLVVKISDHVEKKEAEPEFFFTSSMHGDEVTGYVLLLRLIDHLLSGYSTDDEIRQLIDTVEIWINPNANPDGTYMAGNESVAGAIRYNANHIDLNRNFKDPQEGDHPDGNSWQAETVAMMEFMLNHHFTLSANYHGGAEVLNYPWDCWPRSHCDEDWFVQIAQQYADTVKQLAGSDYFSDVTPSGVTNGYAWYPVYGGRQDFTTYFARGREITIEVSSIKMPPESTLPDYWEYNRRAMLEYIQQCTYGIHGMIRDAQSGAPLEAGIEVINHDKDNSQILSNSLNGDFHRPLAPGTYTLKISKEGYLTQTLEPVTLSSPDAKLWLDIALVPGMDPVQVLPETNISIRWSEPFHAIEVVAEKSCYVQIHLYSLEGRSILDSGRRFMDQDLYLQPIPDDLTSGLYFCTVCLDGQPQKTLKLTISR